MRHSSRLDPVTEAQLGRAMRALLRNRTAIIIAHRLTTIQQVDDILILADGQIQEQGPRAELAADPTSRFAHLLRTGLSDDEGTLMTKSQYSSISPFPVVLCQSRS